MPTSLFLYFRLEIIAKPRSESAGSGSSKPHRDSILLLKTSKKTECIRCLCVNYTLNT
jgi:hypothetical protein